MEFSKEIRKMVTELKEKTELANKYERSVRTAHLAAKMRSDIRILRAALRRKLTARNKEMLTCSQQGNMENNQ